MPVKIYINDEEKWLTPSTMWQSVKGSFKNAEINVDPDFYVSVLNITGN